RWRGPSSLNDRAFSHQEAGACSGSTPGAARSQPREDPRGGERQRQDRRRDRDPHRRQKDGRRHNRKHAHQARHDATRWSGIQNRRGEHGAETAEKTRSPALARLLSGAETRNASGMRRALTFSIVVGAAVLAVALAVVLARTNTNHPSVSESPGVSDSGGSSSGSVGSDGAASFVGTASNAVIFIQWTRAGSNISGA